MEQAKELIPYAPDSALHSLDKILPDYDAMSKKEKAYFGLYYIMALDKNSQEINVTEFITYSIEYFDENKVLKELAYCYLYKARIDLYNNKNYNDAINLLFTGLEFAQKTKDDSLLGKIYFDLGSVSSNQNLTDKAVEYYNNALLCFEKADETANTAKTLTVLGGLYKDTEKYELCLEYYNRALLLTTDSVSIGVVLFHLGNYYYDLFELDSAFYYFQKSLTFPVESYNLANVNFQFADVYYDMNMPDSAIHYVNIALSYPMGYQTKRECYRLLANIAADNDDSKLFDLYFAKYHAYQDSILLQANNSDIIAIENLHLAKKETKRVKTNQYLLLLLLFIMVGFASFVFLYYRKKSNRSERELSKEKKKSKLNERELSIEKAKSNKQLLRQQLLHQIEQTKAKLLTAKKNDNTACTTEEIKDIYNKHLCLQNMEKFIEKMDLFFNDAGTSIRQNYTDVNDKELIYIFMFLLKCKTSDIYFVLDYELSSLRKMRYRLAPKFNLSSAKKLNAFLEAFL